MALVQLTRFDDPHEGQIAAGALKAAGIFAVCHINGYGSMDFMMRQATQGFGLWVEQGDRLEARKLLAQHRKVDPKALAWRDHPEVLSGLPLALAAIMEPNTGWMIASARRRPSPFRITIALLFWLPMAFIISVLVVVTGGWLVL